MSLRAASTALQSRLLVARTSQSSSLLQQTFRNKQEYSYKNNGRPLSAELHTFATRLSLEDNNKNRDERRRLQGLPSIGNIGGNANTAASSAVALYHTSPPRERAVAIILGLGAVSASFYAASTGVKAYNEYKASIPETPVEEVNEEEPAKEQEQEAQQQQQKQSAPSGDRENIFAKWFGIGVGSKYYEGGFEDAITRREAALILGIRESSSAKRIKDAHRKLVMLNHPDNGGSPYMAGKINEAKELLLKGKGRVRS
jgi:DnaJ family protein C protein 19